LLSQGAADESARRHCEQLAEEGGIDPADHRRALHCGVVEPVIAEGDDRLGLNDRSARRALFLENIVPLADRVGERGGEILSVRVGQEGRFGVLEVFDLGEEAERDRYLSH
jgi:hypothetical protein